MATVYPLLLTVEPVSVLSVGTKVRVKSSSVQIVLPIPILRNKKILVSYFIVFI